MHFIFPPEMHSENPPDEFLVTNMIFVVWYTHKPKSLALNEKLHIPHYGGPSCGTSHMANG